MENCSTAKRADVTQLQRLALKLAPFLLLLSYTEAISWLLEVCLGTNTIHSITQELRVVGSSG